MSKSTKAPSREGLVDEIVKLRRAVTELSVLNELAREIGASLDSTKIMRRVLNRSLKAVNAEQGSIILVGQERADPHKTFVRDMVSSHDHQPFHLDKALLGWMHLNKRILSIDDPCHDNRFKGIRWDDCVNSLLCVPLFSKSKLVGILTVLNKRDGSRFNPEDERLLAIIASQSAQVIENARLFEKEQELLKVQEELRLAKEIQLGLLPVEIPHIPHYEIAAKSLPAQEVGGDYYDISRLDDAIIAVCVGDASGHGLPAALLMANLQAIIKCQTFLNCSVQESLRRANTILYRNTQSGCFASFFFGVLNVQTHEFIYANAGHSYPMLIKADGTVNRLSESGVLLGFVPDLQYESSRVEIEPGDVLALFSDGIIEYENNDGDQYGESRFVDMIRANMENSAETLLEQLYESILEFAQNAPQDDDMTLIVLKRHMTE